MRKVFIAFLFLFLVGCAAPEEISELPREEKDPELPVEQPQDQQIVEVLPPQEVVLPPEEPARGNVPEVQPTEQVQEVQESPQEKPQEISPLVFDPVVLKEGTFRPIQQSVQGTARWLNHNGDKKFQLHAFRVNNGPKLHLYLARHPNPSKKIELGEKDEGYLDVGPLETYFGTQMFDLPDDLSPSQYDSAVIFSEGYNVIYATAPLEKP
ncbi:DM13 domain-containing protein [Candidatus Woesearchaeota archaeon]|nr:DM13 domain-containing protein [Candidatus Woesearchaeota archaeon]